MTKNKFLWLLLAYTLFITSVSGKPLPLIAEGAVLMEASTGTILYSKNPYETFYPASTTKVLTTLILAESFSADASITKSQQSVDVIPGDSSHMGLKVGDTYTYEAGLYGIMLASDNFISHDMAMYHSGSIDAFAQAMNEKARRLGAYSSNFVNPHGYHDSNHYTTPYDLARIARGAFSNPIVEKIGGTPHYNLQLLNTEEVFTLKNSAAFYTEVSPYYNPHVTAAKTGYHTPAGRTLVAKGVYDDLTLIAVVMKSGKPHYFKDINTLLDYGQAYFKTTTNASGSVVIENTSYAPWAQPSIKHLMSQGKFVFTPRLYEDLVAPYEFNHLLNKCFVLNKRVNTPYTSPSVAQESLTASQAQSMLEALTRLYHLVLPSDFVTTTLTDIRPSTSRLLTVQDMLVLTTSYENWLVQHAPSYLYSSPLLFN